MIIVLVCFCFYFSYCFCYCFLYCFIAISFVFVFLFLFICFLQEELNMAIFVVFLVNFFKVLFDSMKVERKSREEKIRNYLFI